MAYAVESCHGYRYHPDSCDALGEPRCADCGWSWHAHGEFGRPRPDVEPPHVSDERLAELWAVDEDTDVEPTGEMSGGSE